MKKKVIIIGASGQDGTFLTKLLQGKNYDIVCCSRSDDFQVMLNKQESIGVNVSSIRYEKLDLLNLDSIEKLFNQICPDEIYNLAAQSSVGYSYLCPYETINSSINGTLNILELLRTSYSSSKFYFAGSSECFGDHGRARINEETKFNPLSPYAVAKASTAHLVKSYRMSYKLFACTGFLFNHESHLRGENFVTKKIINSAISIHKGEQNELKLGNVNIHRDWGWAPEYVEAMWLMLQKDTPKDYVIGSGVTHSLKDFIKLTFNYLNLDYIKYLTTDDNLYRPSDITFNRCDPRLAKKELKWTATKSLQFIISNMIDHELNKSDSQ